MDGVRLIKPYVDYNSVVEDFQRVFERGVFTQGPYAKQFAKNLSWYVGAKHTFLTTSATTALSVCLKLLNIKPGDEVAISDFSFPATANVVEDLGARPVFVDVSPSTFNMCVDDLLSKLTPKTKAVIFVDSFGNPTGQYDVKAVCEQHSLPLIEDAACAIGSLYNGNRCGNLSDLTCFSFHPRKLLCTGEGGAITTNNDDWAGWLDAKLAHGARKSSTGSLDFSSFGFNFRMSELQAVMGLTQLKNLNEIILHRQQVRDLYSKMLTPLGFRQQAVSTNCSHNVQSIVFKVPDYVNRDQLIEQLQRKGIETTIGTYCQSGLPYYKAKYQSVQKNAFFLQNNTITLPCFQDVPWKMVCEQIKRLI